MCHMNRLRLVVLLLILGAIVATSPALAVKPGHSFTRALAPPKIDPPEPRARGKYTLEDWGEWSTGTVKCWRLTPAKQYHVVIEIWSDWGPIWWSFPVSADGDGNLSAELLGEAERVSLENDEGDVVLMER